MNGGPPDPITARLLAAVTSTPSGLYLLPPPTPATAMPPAPPRCLVVHVETGASGFTAHGRPLPPTALARVIRSVPAASGRQVVLLLRGRTPRELLRSLLAATADGLGEPVVVSSGAAWAAPGRLLSGGGFLRLDPAPPGDGPAEPRRLGHVLPAPPSPAAPPTPAVAATLVALGTRRAGVALPVRAVVTSTPLAEPAPRRAPGPAPRPERPAAPPPAPDGVSGEAVVPLARREDREALRAVLGWRYEAHARAVTGMLALNPGLRAGAGEADLLAGLVAVRAHLTGTGPAVDAVLRGEPAEPVPLGDEVRELGPDAGRLLARCALAGLAGLPVVVGPVFRPGPPDATLATRYRNGAVLTEPAFVAARTTPAADGAVEYAIWSNTGRRTQGLDAAAPVLFGAGSRFVVLDVEQPGPGAPVRVLLRELPGTRADPQADERARSRLRETATGAAAGVPADTGPGASPPASWRRPIGLRLDGRPFTGLLQQQEPTRNAGGARP